MRIFACATSLSLLLFTPVPQSPAAFPIPEDMHETWLGAKLNDVDKRLLQKAVNADLRDLDEESQSGTKSAFNTVNMADIALGTLGNGVIVLMSGSFFCGTGGCPIYAYVREKDGYRKILGDKRIGPGGWAFAVVNSKTRIPDLVIASNGGGGQMGLGLYRYVGDRFVLQACETLTRKAPESDAGWWEPSAVVVEPRSCGGN